MEPVPVHGGAADDVKTETTSADSGSGLTEQQPHENTADENIKKLPVEEEVIHSESQPQVKSEESSVPIQNAKTDSSLESSTQHSSAAGESESNQSSRPPLNPSNSSSMSISAMLGGAGSQSQSADSNKPDDASSSIKNIVSPSSSSAPLSTEGQNNSFPSASTSIPAPSPFTAPSASEIDNSVPSQPASSAAGTVPDIISRPETDPAATSSATTTGFSTPAMEPASESASGPNAPVSQQESVQVLTGSSSTSTATVGAISNPSSAGTESNPPISQSEPLYSSHLPSSQLSTSEPERPRPSSFLTQFKGGSPTFQLPPVQFDPALDRRKQNLTGPESAPVRAEDAVAKLKKPGFEQEQALSQQEQLEQQQHALQQGQFSSQNAIPPTTVEGEHQSQLPPPPPPSQLPPQSTLHNHQHPDNGVPVANHLHHHHHHHHRHHHHHHHHEDGDSHEASPGAPEPFVFPGNASSVTPTANNGFHLQPLVDGNGLSVSLKRPAETGDEYPPLTVRSQIIVDNSDVLEAITKFPRHILGAVIYEPQSKNSSHVLLPRYDDKINSVIQIRIPRRFLNHQTNLAIPERRLWGTDIYTDDSDIVAALYHNGHLKLPDPLVTTVVDESISPLTDCIASIRILPRLERYQGSYRYGFNSRTWLASHDGVSFMIESVDFVPCGQAEASASLKKQRVSDWNQLRKLSKSNNPEFKLSAALSEKIRRETKPVDTISSTDSPDASKTA
ncbi:Transcriptional regulatory protein RXT3 [Sugiyamaella lignohabitans]|uniref:Transcriptional regulatory protein RXT3 n=1 Tax=Sugiyamaella lignohabitans TaxID=796027 RepID=A0A167D590_9ASCO|nr:Transcriptional regulatory protein RXT3 [Sugiyamaella lignohabitans]ANB12500.1 Transcriptional regulatory protein RXT3 [Sugiyamaella lignohabitans]